MNKKLDNPKIKAALDILLEGQTDLSNVLSKDGLIKELTKAALLHKSDFECISPFPK